MILPMQQSKSDVIYEGRDLEAMSFAQNYYRWVLGIFAPYIGKKVCEVGSGSGNFSSLLLTQPIERLVAIEPSAQMYPLLAQKFESNSKVKTLKALFGDMYREYVSYFDTLVYVNVLEHVENDAQELVYAHEALADDGYLCVFVPALPALYSEFDASVGHYRRYTKTQLQELAQQAGFEIVHIRYFDLVGIVPWYIVFTLFKQSLTAGNTALYDKLAVPVLKIAEAWLPVPIGKNVIMIARKKQPQTFNAKI